MIKKLCVSNFRKVNDEFELTGCDLFVGLNGSGKTAVQNAVEYALTGQVQGVKNAEELHEKFATGPIMSVSIDCDEFFLTRKTIQKVSNKKGVVDIKYTNDICIKPVDDKLITATKKCTDWLKENVNLPSLIFNFTEFLNMTDTQQRDFIQSLVTVVNINFADYIQRLKEKTYLDGMDESYKAKLDDAYALLATQALDHTGEKLLNIMFDYASEKYTEYNRQRKTDQGGANKLTEYKNDLSGNARKIPKLERQIDNNRDSLKSQREELLHSENVIKTKKENQVKLDALQERLDNLKNYDYENSVRLITKSINELKIELKEPVELNSRTLERDQLNDRLVDLKGDLIKHENDIASLNNRMKNITEENKKHSETLSNIQGEFVCPLTKERCNADMASIQKGLNLLIKSNEDELESIKKQLDTLVFAMDQVIEIRNGIKKQIEELDTEVKANKQHYNTIKDHNKSINSNIDQLQEKLNKVTLSKENAATLKTELERQIEELDKIEYKYDDPEELKEIMQGIEEDIQTDEAELSELKEKQQMLKNQMKAIEDAQHSEMLFQVWSDIKTAAGPKGIKGDITKESVTGIYEELNQLLKHIGRSETIFFDFETERGKAIFDFGLVRDGEKINFDTLCGAEKMNLMSCMVVTIMNKIDTKLKVLMIDEVNILYGDDRQNYIEGLSLISQQLDNVIVNGAIDPDELNVYEFEVIEL